MSDTSAHKRPLGRSGEALPRRWDAVARPIPCGTLRAASRLDSSKTHGSKRRLRSRTLLGRASEVAELDRDSIASAREPGRSLGRSTRTATEPSVRLGLLERLVRRRPVVLALDGVRRADAASGELTARLVPRFREPLLGTGLDGAIRATLCRLRRKSLLPRAAGPGRPPARSSSGRSTEQPAPLPAPPPLVAGAKSRRAERGLQRCPIGSSRGRRGGRVIRTRSGRGDQESPLSRRWGYSTLGAGILDDLVEVAVIRRPEAPRRFRFRHPIVHTVICRSNADRMTARRSCSRSGPPMGGIGYIR